MKKIQELSPQIVSKIAAGEVIERPVFAVKELVENALDAGADEIVILVEQSGLKRIQVIDNGEGMNLEDLKECFKPHTTSKLSTFEDLSCVKTLGFRGEALASIASIGQMTIASRRSQDVSGMKLTIKNGRGENILPVGMPSGTNVTVNYLFHAVPARKKFLKSPRTEFRHIIELLTGYALSYPQVAFVLTHNKKTIFDLPKTTDPLQRIEKLLGKDIFASLIPLNYNDSYIGITGFLAKPSMTTRTPSKQFFFINSRFVNDKEISQSIKSAYGSLLPSSVYPIGIVYFSLPFEMVDVNVHPRKEYVRFTDHILLHDAIKHAVKQTLSRYDLIADVPLDTLLLGDAVGSTDSYAGRLLKEKKLPWELPKEITTDQSTIIQLHNLYILVVLDRGFFLIDQHAAHERILFEQLLKEFASEKKKHAIFHFSKPSVFDLNASESELLLEQLPRFQTFGWEIEHFKDHSFILRSLPVLFQDRDHIKLLREMLEDLREDHLEKSVDSISERMIAYIACRIAVKAGDSLTKKQLTKLVEQLEQTHHNATCPHGRPTKVWVGLERIDKLFKR